jgi:hypothetical protein
VHPEPRIGDMNPRVVLGHRLVHGYRCQPLIERVASDYSCVIQDAGRCNEGGLANGSNVIRRVRAGRVQLMGVEYRDDPAPVGVHYQLWQ